MGLIIFVTLHYATTQFKYNTYKYNAIHCMYTLHHPTVQYNGIQYITTINYIVIQYMHTLHSVHYHIVGPTNAIKYITPHYTVYNTI